MTSTGRFPPLRIRLGVISVGMQTQAIRLMLLSCRVFSHYHSALQLGDVGELGGIALVSYFGG